MLRLMMGGSTNDVRAQLSALRDLGALPADADLDEVSRELKLEDPFVDPLSLSGEQLVGELQQVVKALLGFGARMPKELMLFVKNMVFLDNAIATLAPDLDMIDEVAQMSIYFATRHGERILADVGIDPRSVELDMAGVKANLGVDDSVDSLTYRELQQRREAIREKLSSQSRRGRKPRDR
jgi:ubiquinone biosynthesis protein